LDAGRREAPVKKKHPQWTPEEEASYQVLLADIKKLIEEARAKGVDFGARTDLFTCRACGGYEDESFKGEPFVCFENGLKAGGATRFIDIDWKETTRRLKNGQTRCRLTYTFICSLCGTYQTEQFVNDWDPI
jgi:hypothetical protein